MDYKSKILISCSVLSALSFNIYPQKVKKNKKYNVLFIAVDDLRTELGCYGNSVIKTPNIDKLGSEGVVFQKAYCQQAISMASRASLLTGIKPENNLIYENGTANAACPGQDKIEDVFRKNQYTIQGYGKIYNYYSDNSEQFGESYLEKNPKSKAKGRDFLEPENHKLIKEDGHWGGPAYEMADVADNEYVDGFLAEETCKKLKQFAKSKEPFYMALGFRKPHLPFNAPKKYWDLYQREDIQLAENQTLPMNYNKFTQYNFEELRNGYDFIPRNKDLIPSDLQHTLKHGYYACVSYVDAQIGKVLDQLKKSGLDKNTIVVLWGDHGWKLGEHGMWCKHTNFDLDTRVPLIIKTPNGKSGVSQSFVELLDLYPTLMDLCNLEKPKFLDGNSIVNEIIHPDQVFRTEAYSMYPYRNQVIGYSIVNKDFRYIQYVHIPTGKVEADELYDHSIDRGENINISAYPEYSDIKERMSAVLRTKWKMDSSILNTLSH